MPRSPDVYSWGPLDLSTRCSVNWGLDDLLSLTESQTENTLSQHRVRKLWHPEDVDSVVLFLARYGSLDLRQELVRQSFSKPSKKPSPPSNLKQAVLFKVQVGSDDLRRRVLLAALSGGGRSRVRERVGRKKRSSSA
jgi:hypothetical protein